MEHCGKAHTAHSPSCHTLSRSSTVNSFSPASRSSTQLPERLSSSAACAKAAAGALEYLPVAKCANIGAAITELKKAGVFILAADMGGEDAGSVDFDLPCAIVIGAEGSGVSESVKKAADRVVSIPQRGRIQSLNASNAAAILLYAAQRSRG